MPPSNGLLVESEYKVHYVELEVVAVGDEELAIFAQRVATVLTPHAHLFRLQPLLLIPLAKLGKVKVVVSHKSEEEAASAGMQVLALLRRKAFSVRGNLQRVAAQALPTDPQAVIKTPPAPDMVVPTEKPPSQIPKARTGPKIARNYNPSKPSLRAGPRNETDCQAVFGVLLAATRQINVSELSGAVRLSKDLVKIALKHLLDDGQVACTVAKTDQRGRSPFLYQLSADARAAGAYCAPAKVTSIRKGGTPRRVWE